MRFRGRRAIVEVSVVKLRGRKTSGGGLVRGQLAYLQREEAGVTVVTDLDGAELTVPCHGQLYGPEDGVEIDGRDFVERSFSGFDGRGDPHQFRIISRRRTERSSHSTMPTMWTRTTGRARRT